MNARATPFAKATARERITQVIEGWFLTEPLLFAAWTLHDVVQQPRVATIRVGHGRIEFNPTFIASLRRDDLRSVLAFETMRILLGHPYARRKPNAELSYLASNLTVQECLRTKLPIPRAREVLGDASFDDQYFEFYYRELDERSGQEPDESPSDSKHDDPSDDENGQPADGELDSPAAEDQQADQQRAEQQTEQDAEQEQAGEDAIEGQASNQTGSEAQSDLQSYSDPSQVGIENTADWDSDDLQHDEIVAAVREAAESGGWGTIGGSAREQLLATLHPKLDYRGVLRNFRQSVLSVRRRLTRMKPSRRYGFAQLGSRYDFTTRLLFAVDVSGSMSRRDLQLGFSVVSRFFRYGVESVDVIWFDEQIRCEPLTLRQARSSFEVTGRGGTNFRPLIEFIDRNRQYDGLIIFTDGYAPVPPKPKNKRTRILWLFKDEATYQRMGESLRPLGRSVFLKAAGQ